MFVYKVTILPTDQFYFGSRYDKNAKPESLGNSYFTSSPEVQQLIFLHGSKNVKFEILHEFLSKEECLKCESQYIKNNLYQELCLNKQRGYNLCKNKVWVTDGINELRIFKGLIPPSGFVFGRSDKMKDIVKNNTKRFDINPEKRQKGVNAIRNSKWVNNGFISKRIKEETIPKGFKIGRIK